MYPFSPVPKYSQRYLYYISEKEPTAHIVYAKTAFKAGESKLNQAKPLANRPLPVTQKLTNDPHAAPTAQAQEVSELQRFY